MPVRAPLSDQPSFALAPADAGRLRSRVAEAARRARRDGVPVLASLTVALEGTVDPAAVAWASRRDGEPLTVLEQPDRESRALSGLGAALRISGTGEGRFTGVAARWRETAARAVHDDAEGPGAEGLVAVGGFAFDPSGGSAPHWRGFPPAELVVPELALWRRRERTSLTLGALVAPDDDVEAIAERLLERVRGLRDRALPVLDPAPTERAGVVSAMPPAHYEAAVAGAVQRIAAGELGKIVLAREVQVHAPRSHDAAAVFAVLREAFPSCFVFALGRGESTFLAASPELLVRRDGARAATLALAGSMRRSADPAVDAHLGEQLLRSEKDREEHAIVIRRIEHALAPHSVWVTAASEPEIVRVANIQHLATPIRAQLAHPVDAIDLLGFLHPTPAVGGEPRDRAVELIPALEGLDRGWYAGPVGWTDVHGNGEFCVALRCALLHGRLARCYAGVGVVRDSDPAAELAETELKLQALLPVLAA